jgi:hypothetical protein
MSQRTYTPGIGNAPFGNVNTNPQASQYGAESGYTAQESLLIAKAIKEAIFDAAPDQYNALKLVFEKGFTEYNNDEFEYLEHTFGRSALEANAVVVAQPAVAGAVQTQVIAFTAATISHVGQDLILVYPDGTKGIVRSIIGLNVTVESQTSAGLPAVAVGDIFSIQSTIYGDGENGFSNYERLEVITRYNYIQQFLRACRWGRVELLKHQNSGTTNFLEKDKKEKMRQLRTDLFNSFFNGTRGEFRLASGLPVKSMGGVFPTMVNAGSMNANPTLAGLRAAFEKLAFATNHKKEGGTRMIYATDEMLYELSKIFKDPGTRYAPSDKVADMNLTEYKMGSMRFVPVSCELFKDQSCFPKDWNRKMLVLDQETINPVKMKGLPAMETGTTLSKGPNGTRENFEDTWYGANLSLEFNNPLGSFYLDVA